MNDLWEKYRNSRSDEDRNALVLHYLPRFKSLISSRTGRGVEEDEIKSAVAEGLIGAIETFDPRKNAAFMTWANHCIVGRISDYFRYLDPMPRRVRSFQKQKCESLLMEQQGQSEEEQATQIGMSFKKFEKMNLKLAAQPIVDSDILEENEVGVYDNVKLDHQDELNYVLRKLPDIYANILLLRFGHSVEYREIGRTYSRSAAWAHMACKNVMKRLTG